MSQSQKPITWNPNAANMNRASKGERMAAVQQGGESYGTLDTIIDAVTNLLHWAASQRDRSEELTEENMKHAMDTAWGHFQRERLMFHTIAADGDDAKAACKALVAFADKNNIINLTGNLAKAVSLARKAVAAVKKARE